MRADVSKRGVDDGNQKGFLTIKMSYRSHRRNNNYQRKPRASDFVMFSVQELKTRIKKVNKQRYHLEQMDRYRTEIKLILNKYLPFYGERLDKTALHQLLNKAGEYWKFYYYLGKSDSSKQLPEEPEKEESLPEPIEFEFIRSELSRESGDLAECLEKFYNVCYRIGILGKDG